MILLDNGPDSEDTVFCERHWQKDYPKIKDNRKSSPSDASYVTDCIKSSLLCTVPTALRKTVRAQSEMRNIASGELCLFEQETELKIFTMFNKNRSLLILTILALLCINEMKN